LRRLVLPLIATALLLLVPAALASRPAHSGEKRQIARAIRAADETRLVRGKFKVTHVRVSTVDRDWAKALAQPKRRYRNQFDTATVAVHRGTHGRWRVRSLGTADVGCAIHRRAVRHDLGLACSG
jgi:hypothetical protein